ncbi:LOW QUALITY PROTEIN: hypothetical protein Q4I28_007610 [Leishmania naiffi]|uniref:Uncharacterized protein n=1 Tax=Leishmania naiffi TaxID=5678 RepID=A0AAW3B931_9TRYP
MLRFFAVALLRCELLRRAHRAYERLSGSRWTAGCHLHSVPSARCKDAKLRLAATRGRYYEVALIGEENHFKDSLIFARGAPSIVLNGLEKKLSDPELQAVRLIFNGALLMGLGVNASESCDAGLLNAIRSFGLGTDKACPSKQASHYLKWYCSNRADKVRHTKEALLTETKHCGVNIGIIGDFQCVHAIKGKFIAPDYDILTFKKHKIGNITGPGACLLLINSVRHKLTTFDHGNDHNTIRIDIEGAEQAVCKAKRSGKSLKHYHIACYLAKLTTDDPVKFMAELKSTITQFQHKRGVFNAAEQVRATKLTGMSEPSCPLSQP